MSASVALRAGAPRLVLCTGTGSHCALRFLVCTADGAHFKDVDHSQKATKVTFDSDDE